MNYNPIRRNFYKLRRVLVETLGLPRSAIRPTSTFAELIPRDQRRRVWQRFRQEELHLDPLAHSCGQWSFACLSAIGFFVLAVVFLGISWLVGCLGAISAIGVFVVVLSCLQPWSTDIDVTYTLGDAALRLTTIKECHEAGYRFTRNEIYLKVCGIIVDCLNVDCAEIKPEMSFNDLGAE